MKDDDSMKKIKETNHKNSFLIAIIFVLKKYTAENAPIKFLDLCKIVYGTSDEEWNGLERYTRRDRMDVIEDNIHKYNEVCFKTNGSYESPICVVDDSISREKWELYYMQPFSPDEIEILIDAILQYNKLEAQETINIIDTLKQFKGKDWKKGNDRLDDFCFDASADKKLINTNLNYALAYKNAEEKKKKKDKNVVFNEKHRYQDVEDKKPRDYVKAAHFEKVDTTNNLRVINELLSSGKKISFNLYKYTCDGSLVHIRDSERYIVSPIAVANCNGRPWLIALMDKYKTEGMTLFPIDMMDGTTIWDNEKEPCCSIREEEQPAVLLNEVVEMINVSADISDVEKRKRENYKKTLANWDNEKKYYFLSEHMGLSYDAPEEIVIRVKKNDTSYSLIYNTFGNDFYPLSKGEHYDRILVIRSPYAIVNWALNNCRDIEVETESVRMKIRERLEKLNTDYVN